MGQLVNLEIDVLPVACPLCGEKVVKLNREHAMKHGFKTLTEYKEKAGINFVTLAQRTRKKIFQLYNIDQKRWVVGYLNGNNMRYVTKNYVENYDEAVKKGMRSASKFQLSDQDFNRHLKGNNPIAIFAYGKNSRYFGFDIDSKELAPGHVYKLMNVLESEGIPREHIHVSFSGSKGYHIEIFTDKHIRIAEWAIFARYIIDKAKLSNESIEFRPTANNGHAWKLPLTFHPKTGNFAGYCDRVTLDVLDVIESHDYIFEIEQLDATSIIFPILEKAKRHESEILKRQAAEKEKERREKDERRKAVKVTEVDLFKTSVEKQVTAVKLLNEGLPGKGTRWNAMRNVLIPYLKEEQGMEPEEVRDLLVEWTAREIENGKVGTSYENCIKEIDQLIDTYFDRIEGFFTRVRDIEITRGEIEWVVGVLEKVKSSSRARDLLWVLLLISKAYKKKDGTFFASRELIQKLMRKQKDSGRFKTISPLSIQKYREWLKDNGYLTFSIPDNHFKERKATIYKLSYVEEQPEIIDSLTFDDDLDSQTLLRQIAIKLYTPKALKKLKLIG